MTYTNEQIVNYFKIMQQTLSPRRYTHSLGVAYLSASLGYVYGVPQDKALVAGILHDNAKEIPGEKLITLCDECGVMLSCAERMNTSLIHPRYGAYLAKHKYGIEDEDIINAISNHTIGRENMSYLEQIVFCADFLEPMRMINSEPSLDKLRALAFKDINLTTVLILENVVSYIKTRPESIDQASLLTLEYYKQKVKEDKNNGR